MSNDLPTPLLSWVHFSDIHCGQGDRYESGVRKDVLRAAVRDAAKLLRDKGLSLDFGLISGDLFQRGGTTKAERDELNEFVDNLVSELAMRDGIYCVPGNHDVNRGVEKKDSDVLRLLKSLRSNAAEPVEDALEDAKERARLLSRFRNYGDWLNARKFNKDSTEIAPLAWERTWEIEGVRIRLRGVNSAWLCMDDRENGRLQIQLGSIARTEVRSDPDTVTMITFHHPAEWCRNRKDIKAQVLRHYDVLLTGHIHKASTWQHRSGSGHEFVHIMSGAVHDPTKRGRKWKREDNYRYCLCTVLREPNGDIVLHQWPRRWRQKDVDFAVDTDLTDGSSPYSKWVLKKHRDADPATPSPALGRATAKQIIGSVNVETAIERFGARRTAFPTDHSIAELGKQKLIVPPAFSSADKDEFSLDELASEVLGGKHVLILGSPGSGKSVALYSLAERLKTLGAKPIPLRFSDLRRLFASGIGLSHGFSVGEEDKSVVVLVDGLDEASVSAGIGVRTISQWLEEIARQFTLVLSCRRAEFEMQLAAYVAQISFSHLAHLKFWRPEVEFKDFIDRLVAAGLLQDDSLLSLVDSDATIQSFAARPLFARMLCLVGSEAARSVKSLEDLYISFFEGLERRTDASLADADCYLGDGAVGRLWSEAAWQSFRLGLLEDEALQYPTLLSVLSGTDADDECIARALTAIIDSGSKVRRLAASYVHYSFYEFLLSSALERRILGPRPLAQDRDSIEVLYNDIPRRVRHFLVNRLRKTGGPRGKQQLLDAYRYLRTQFALEESRTGCNLIVYILSRVYACYAELRELQAKERDLFIRNSLFWGLAHSGDAESTERFLRSLEESPEHIQMCRGYLLYYHGDLGFESDPPFLDDKPFVKWPRTRSAVTEMVASESYAAEVRPQRRIIDVYTLMSLAAAREEKFDDRESRIIRSCIDDIAKIPSTAAWVRDLLERDYHRTCQAKIAV